MRPMVLALLFVAIGAATTSSVDLDKVLRFADLKVELLSKVRQDIVKHLSVQEVPSSIKNANINDVLRKSIKRRADKVFGKLDTVGGLDLYSEAVKSRVLEGVSIKVSENASSFIKPLVKNTLLYKVNSTSKQSLMVAPFAKNVILTCSGNVIQVIDLNGRLKTETVVNFQPEFIRSLSGPGLASGKSSQQ